MVVSEAFAFGIPAAVSKIGIWASIARRSCEAMYNEETNYRMLKTIYEQAIEVRERGRDTQ